MKLKEYISTVDDRQNWKEHLRAGYEEGNEYVLIELMNYCREQMLDLIEEKHMDLSTNSLEKTFSFLKSESKKRLSVGDNNCIEDPFNKLVSLTNLCL